MAFCMENCAKCNSWNEYPVFSHYKISFFTQFGTYQGVHLHNESAEPAEILKKAQALININSIQLYNGTRYVLNLFSVVFWTG